MTAKPITPSKGSGGLRENLVQFERSNDPSRALSDAVRDSPNWNPSPRDLETVSNIEAAARMLGMEGQSDPMEAITAQ